MVLLNNQTLVLGGLIQNKRDAYQDRHPVPEQDPGPRLSLRDGREQIEKTELLLLITPRVIGTAIDAARITDQMRRVTPELEDSIKDKQFPVPVVQAARHEAVAAARGAAWRTRLGGVGGAAVRAPASPAEQCSGGRHRRGAPSAPLR